MWRWCPTWLLKYLRRATDLELLRRLDVQLD